MGKGDWSKERLVAKNRLKNNIYEDSDKYCRETRVFELKSLGSYPSQTTFGASVNLLTSVEF